ncbi:MAG TPA: hypothetical protein VL117_10105 [Thermoleophilia bacterium]|nr:hypothetical protein [Thermoleophilia bacterium]
MDAEVAVARQLVDAFDDALETGDADAREYAEQQLADFVDELGDGTADEVLLALLDLPLDDGTFSLLHEVAQRLLRRGPGVVGLLLETALGDAPPELSVRDIVSVAGAVGALLEAATRRPDLPDRTANAFSVMDAMAQGDLILGLIEVLEAPGNERLKRAAGEMLVEIGEPAVARLEMSLRDRDAEPWVTDVLVDIREGRELATDAPAAEPDDVSDDMAEHDGTGDPADIDDSADIDAVPDDSADDVPHEIPDDDIDVVPDDSADDATGHEDAVGNDPAGGSAPLPGPGDIDRDYDAFLDRFRRETGQR